MHHELQECRTDELPLSQPNRNGHGWVMLAGWKCNPLVIRSGQLSCLCLRRLVKAELHPAIAAASGAAEGHGMDVPLEVLQKPVYG
jgi:hypothetical protein